MMRRPRRRLPAALVALALLAAAVVVTMSCVALLLDKAPLLPFAALADTAGTVRWNQPVVLAIAALTAILGLVLLGAALLPGTPTVLGLDRRDGQPAAGATRRSLNRALTAAARGVDGVDTATVRVKPRTVAATVRTPLHDTAALPEQVQAAITERLDDIALVPPPRIRVRTSNTRGT